MNEQCRILIADDDPHIVKLLSRYLEREGWTVAAVSNGCDAFELAASAAIDLVVLDVMMPGLDGISVCREIRSVSDVPIIMLTAKDNESDKIGGLTAGADDYITKPFSIHEAIARIKAVLRRSPVRGSDRQTESRREQLLEAGPIVMDCGRFEVRVGGNEVRLTATEFELLRFLIERPRQVFTKEQLLREVWKQDYGTDDNTVMVHMRRLRKKIESDPDHPVLLTTVWGIGYRLEDSR